VFACIWRIAICLSVSSTVHHFVLITLLCDTWPPLFCYLIDVYTEHSHGQESSNFSALG